MSTFFKDTFQGTASTPLVSHTADFGGGWHAMGTDAAVLNGSGKVAGGASTAFTATPPSADYEISSPFTFGSSYPVSAYGQLFIRADVSSLTYYTLGFISGNWYILKYRANVFDDNLGAFAIEESAGETVTMRLQANGNVFKAFRNGTEIISCSDPATNSAIISATGKAGFLIYDTAGGAAWGKFEAYPIGGKSADLAIGTPTVNSSTGTTASLTSPAATGGIPSVAYQWYRSTTSGFTPGGGNILSGQTSLTVNDTGLTPGTNYYYKVVASDASAATATSAQASVSTGATTVIAVNNAALFWSPYNWYFNGSTSARSSCPAAYLRFKFSGSTAVALRVDTSGQTGSGINMGVKWSIDGGAVQTGTILEATSTFTLASGLGGGTHTVEFTIVGFDANLGLWSGVPIGRLEITGIQLDSGGTVAAPDNIRPKRAVVYGDSISIAAFLPDINQAWASIVPLALNAEYGVVGYSRQGWAYPGYGDVPGVFVTGDDTNSSWNKFYAGLSRLVSGAFSPPPDYVFASLGTNDNFNSVSDATVTASVQNWLTAVRAAAPGARICVIIPSSQYKASAITAGFNAYQIAIGDWRNTLVDLGAAAAFGLNGTPTPPTVTSNDGVHPNALKQATDSSAIIQAIQATTKVSVIYG